MALHMIVGWFAVLTCVLFAWRIATVFLAKQSRLFTVMVLFSFSWVVLLPYYSGAKNYGRPELIQVYTGFLTVYIGFLLLEAAQAFGSDLGTSDEPGPPSGSNPRGATSASRSRGSGRSRKVGSPQPILEGTGESGPDLHEPILVRWQKRAFWVLLLAAAPSAIGLVGPDEIPLIKLTWPQTDLLIGTFLGIAGFVPIVIAVKRLGLMLIEQSQLPGSKLRKQREEAIAYAALYVLATILLLYSLTGVAFMYVSWPQTNAGADMTAPFAYLFASLKLAYTFALSGFLGYYAMPEKQKLLRPWAWIELFF